MVSSILKQVKKKLDDINLKREDSTYSLTPFLLKWIQDHPPEMTFETKSSEITFNDWKKQVHELITEKLRIIEPIPISEQKVEFHGETTADGIKFIKLSLMALPGLRVPAILCIPENLTSKTPAIICIHGHEQGKENSAGLKKSPNKEYFGYELAKLGVITLSLDWLGMGERESRITKFFLSLRNEDRRSNWVRFLGLDMIGLRITEVKALLNYLETREKVDAKRFGIVGHSGGGTLSLFTTIVEPRIKVTCISGYFGTWDHSILAMYHCGCNFISDLRKYLELYDVFASLAPHPVAIVMGEKDGIFPIEGTKKAIPIVKKAYANTKNPENFLADIHPRRHEFNGDKVYPFMLKHLQKVI